MVCFDGRVRAYICFLEREWTPRCKTDLTVRTMRGVPNGAYKQQPLCDHLPCVHLWARSAATITFVLTTALQDGVVRSITRMRKRGLHSSWTYPFTGGFRCRKSDTGIRIPRISRWILGLHLHHLPFFP